MTFVDSTGTAQFYLLIVYDMIRHVGFACALGRVKPIHRFAPLNEL